MKKIVHELYMNYIDTILRQIYVRLIRKQYCFAARNSVKISGCNAVRDRGDSEMSRGGGRLIEVFLI